MRSSILNTIESTVKLKNENSKTSFDSLGGKREVGSSLMEKLVTNLRDKV